MSLRSKKGIEDCIFHFKPYTFFCDWDGAFLCEDCLKVSHTGKGHNKIDVDAFVKDSRIMVSRVHDELTLLIAEAKGLVQKKEREEWEKIARILDICKEAMKRVEKEMYGWEYAVHITEKVGEAELFL